MAHFYFNTAWIENNKLVLQRPEIDKVHSDKKFKKYTKDFTLVLQFTNAEVSTITKMKTGGTTKEKKEKKEKREKKEKKDKKDKKSKKSKSSKLKEVPMEEGTLHD
jgi:hypothetical protein